MTRTAAALVISLMMLAAAVGPLPTAPAPATPTVTPAPSRTPSRTPLATPPPSRTPTPTVTPTATPGPYGVTWGVDCADDARLNGYLFGSTCLPGLVSWETSRMSNPPHFVGLFTQYAPGVMEEVVRNRGLSMSGYEGAVALPLCGDIGTSVWLQRPEHDWEGPFLVADCSGRNGVFYHVLTLGLAGEVDAATAQRWGGGNQAWVHVCRSKPPCGGAWSLQDYFLERLTWATEDAPEKWTP